MSTHPVVEQLHPSGYIPQEYVHAFATKPHPVPSIAATSKIEPNRKLHNLDGWDGRNSAPSQPCTPYNSWIKKETSLALVSSVAPVWSLSYSGTEEDPGKELSKPPPRPGQDARVHWVYFTVIHCFWAQLWVSAEQPESFSSTEDMLLWQKSDKTRGAAKCLPFPPQNLLFLTLTSPDLSTCSFWSTTTYESLPLESQSRCIK